MKKYFLLISLFTSMMAFCQKDYEERQRQMKVNNEHLNNVYQNNLPNARGSNVRDVSKDIQNAREAQQKKEAEAAKRQQEINDTSEWYKGYLVEKAEERVKRIEKIKNAHRETHSKILMEYPELDFIDRCVWSNDVLFVSVEGPKMKYFENEIKNLNYEAAYTAITYFQKTKETATFEELKQLIEDGKLHFASDYINVTFLYTRFPERTKEIELLELALMPYHLGANRSYLDWIFDDEGGDTLMTYPASNFEFFSKGHREMLLRFLDLIKKYPEEGEAALKLCRYNLNPYMKYVMLEKPSGSAQNEMYFKAIYSKIDNYDYRVAFKALVKDEFYFKKLKELSLEQWLEMAKKQDRKINYNYHTKVPYKYKGEIKLGEIFNNLNKAYKVWEKEYDREAKKRRK